MTSNFAQKVRRHQRLLVGGADNNPVNSDWEQGVLIIMPIIAASLWVWGASWLSAVAERRDHTTTAQVLYFSALVLLAAALGHSVIRFLSP